MKRIGRWLAAVIVAGVLVGLTLSIARRGVGASQPETAASVAEIGAVAHRLDELFGRQWANDKIEPAPAADDLTVIRRLSLALVGKPPSLEELRGLEKLPDNLRVNAHLDRLLTDERFHDYFAERLARAFVPSLPVEPFFIYRRRRFTSWLSEQIRDHRPYDDLARELISAEGLWTEKPAVNFITSHELDPIRLAAKTSRAFLGLRTDCAQCHDDKFKNWKQSQFNGLAAYYGRSKLGFFGVHDTLTESQIEDSITRQKKVVDPCVPFLTDAATSDVPLRQQLANWVTSPNNAFFGKAIANRVWTLLLGRGLVEPVDDLEGKERVPGVLEFLATDFRGNGHDLHRLIRVIAATRSFRLASAMDQEGDASSQTSERLFARFPISRLRAEQVAAAVVQSSTLHTLNTDRHPFVRFLQLVNENALIERYGDAQEEELEPRGGNVPQRLLLMNDEIVRERMRADLLRAAGRLARLAPTDEQCVDLAYLITLTRHPTPPEQEYFTATIAGKTGDDRATLVEDMMWALVNSTEFSWNH